MTQDLTQLTAEIARLRAALAHSKDPCAYCSLPAEELAKCERGFPGCGRADDMTGCPEFGAALALHEHEETQKALKEALTLLTRAHTSDDELLGFHVLLGAAPVHSQRRAYLDAWRTVRQYLNMQVEAANGWDDQ